MVPTPWPIARWSAKVVRGLPVLPSLLCTGAPCFSAETVSHPLCFLLACSGISIRPWCWGGGPAGRRDVGKPLAPVVQLYRHVGPDPGVASLSPFICLSCELLSFFPWRKDTSSNLAEGENLSHTCLLWLWYPARGKGQSPGVMVQWAELIEGRDVHPAFSWTRSLKYSLQVKMCKIPPTKHFPRWQLGYLEFEGMPVLQVFGSGGIAELWGETLCKKWTEKAMFCFALQPAIISFPAECCIFP